MAYLYPLFTRSKLNGAIFLLIVLVGVAKSMAINLTLPSEHGPMCTAEYEWTGKSYDPNDCLRALHRLEDTDFVYHKAREFEFLSYGAEPKTNLPRIRLPRRYTVGSCEIVIAMISTFPPNSLPGQTFRTKPYESTDISRFSYLWSIAAWLDATCLDKANHLGWVATGQNYDIGVFVWATGSSIGKRTTQNSIYRHSNSTRLLDARLKTTRTSSLHNRNDDKTKI